jgi:hypothetical protein
MSKSKQEIGQIIRQTLLGSENPTKRQICIIMVMHVMVIAMVFVAAFVHSAIASLGWMGLFWVVLMAQGIVVGLTDNSDRYIWQVVNQFFRRTTSPTKGEKRFAITAGILVGIIMLLVFALLISGFNNIFGWLIYGAFGGLIALAVAANIWRVRDIARRIKAHRQQEETA